MIAAEMLSGAQGWALTSEGLWRTEDAGGQWESIEPPGLPVGAIEAFKFIDASHGVAVPGEEGNDELALRRLLSRRRVDR